MVTTNKSVSDILNFPPLFFYYIKLYTYILLVFRFIFQNIIFKQKLKKNIYPTQSQ